MSIDAFPHDDAAPPSPEHKALAFLSREVPSWSAENNCFSCHNNGDAARALFMAARLGEEISDDILADTVRWLSRPQMWPHNGGDTPFDDRQLADLQFAAALADGIEAQVIRDRKPLQAAAGLVAKWQNDDGSWSLKPNPQVGSPTIWPRMLATVLSRSTLSRAPAEKEFAQAIRKADDWLARQHPQSVIDAASLLLAPHDVLTDRQRTAALALIAQGQSRDGGWGPFVNSPPEAFDTSIVLLALAQAAKADDDALKKRIQRGRAYLVRMQLPEGSWQETTRPPGAESYAQRMSTTGWATLALLATRPK